MNINDAYYAGIHVGKVAAATILRSEISVLLKDINFMYNNCNMMDNVINVFDKYIDDITEPWLVFDGEAGDDQI